MPIDFNPNVAVCYNQVMPQKNYNIAFGQTGKDTFTKTVVSNDYAGIKIEKKNFGTVKKTNEVVQLYTITNKNGAKVSLSSFGATITSIKVPDKNGKVIDVAQGYKNVTPYEESPVGHAGGTIGPCANKISEGKFVIDGQKYNLECNKDNGKSHCHGGSAGFDVKNWKPEILSDGIKFTYNKKDMENGYPGNVEASVTYKFDNENNLHIIYSATTDKDTLINMTNHTYFNLDGAENAAENSVYNHVVTLPNSSTYTENNELAIPNGNIINVQNSPFDFSTPKKIGDVIDAEHPQIKIAGGFDQNYCIDNYDGTTLIEVANIKSEVTGINLKVLTNLPGFQFYTSNHLGKSTQPKGKDGKRYEKRSSFCVEPQFYPNAINTEQFKEKPILKSGDTYSKEIVYNFSTYKN